VCLSVCGESAGSDYDESDGGSDAERMKAQPDEDACGSGDLGRADEAPLVGGYR
jgi:hypothetical protein